MPGASHQTFHFNSSNANDIFRNFFGTSDPFAANEDDSPFAGFSGLGGPGGIHSFMSMGGMPPRGMPDMNNSSNNNNNRKMKKGDAVNYPLNVSLEDLYIGTGWCCCCCCCCCCIGFIKQKLW
jgi:DnaJ-class molecular chaperone